MTVDEALSRATISVPEAGKIFFDMERGASYEAAKRGDIQTVEIGGKKRVPVAPIAAKLGLQMKIGQAA